MQVSNATFCYSLPIPLNTLCAFFETNTTVKVTTVSALFFGYMVFCCKKSKTPVVVRSTRPSTSPRSSAYADAVLSPRTPPRIGEQERPPSIVTSIMTPVKIVFGGRHTPVLDEDYGQAAGADSDIE